MMEPLELDEYAPPTRLPLGSLNPNQNNGNNTLRKKPPIATSIDYKPRYEELIERQCQWEVEKQQLMECLGKQMDENRTLKTTIELLERKVLGMNVLENDNNKKQTEASKILSESEEANRRIQKKLATYKTRVSELTSENRTLKNEYKGTAAEIHGLQQQVAENQAVEDELVNSLQKAQDELDSFKRNKSTEEEQLTLSVIRNDIREGNMQLLEQIQHVMSMTSTRLYSDSNTHTHTTQPGTTNHYSDKYSPSSNEEESPRRNDNPSSLMISLTPKELFTK